MPLRCVGLLTILGASLIPADVLACFACDDKITFERKSHLQCLEFELPALLKEAAILEPVLVNLSICSPQVSAVGCDQDTLGDILLPPCGGIDPPAEDSEGGDIPERPSLYYLSYEQLSCLQIGLDVLKSKAIFPVEFKFTNCEHSH